MLGRTSWDVCLPFVVVHDRNCTADNDRIMHLIIVLNTQHILDIKPKVPLREVEAYELHIRMSICTILPQGRKVGCVVS